MKFQPPLAPAGRKMGALARFVTGLGLSAVALALIIFAGLLYLADMPEHVTPVELYHRTWEAVQDNAYDPKMLKDWSQWEHKHDADIKTDEDAINYANEMIESTGDHYAGLLPPAAADAEHEHASGKFVGIGVEVGARVDENEQPVMSANPSDGPLARADAAGNPEIIRVLPGGPAEKAGLKDGDHIISVNGQPLQNISLKTLMSTLKGRPGETLTMQVLRDGKTVSVNVVRGTVKTQTVTHKMLTTTNGTRVGYIRLEDFGNESSPQDMLAAVKDLKDSDKLVIDLRHNPGGEVQVCLQLVSIFMENGRIVSMRERSGGEYNTTVFSVDNDKLLMTRKSESGRTRSAEIDRMEAAGAGKKIVILVDGRSASAAEMFTGALKDNGLAVVVGERTFGKGIGQSVLPMPNGTSLHITSLRYYTPSGKWLGDGGNSAESYGIDPDHEVKLSSRPGVTRTGPNDNQLSFALDLLSKH